MFFFFLTFPEVVQEEVHEDASCVSVGAVKSLLVLGQASGILGLALFPHNFSSGPSIELPAHHAPITSVSALMLLLWRDLNDEYIFKKLNRVQKYLYKSYSNRAFRFVLHEN